VSKAKAKKTKTQTIYRVACRHKPYAQLGNAMIRDNRLSFEARGVLAYILSYPDDWRFSREWLCKRAKLARNRSYKLIAQLIEHGYCQRRQGRKSDGTMEPYEYVFTDEPGSIEPERQPEPEPDAYADGADADVNSGDTQDMGGVDNGAAAGTQGCAPPLPRNREAVNRFPENRGPVNREPVNGEAAIRKKDTNTVFNEDPPVVPQQAGGRSPRGRSQGRPRATYLPEDWALPEADRAWALTHAPQLAHRIDEESHAFRDWHAGKRRADWSARWRTWVRQGVRGAAKRDGHRAADRAAPAGFGHAPRFSGIRNADEPFADYRERMIREGKYRPSAGGAA
jgi:hypothetical protein